MHRSGDHERSQWMPELGRSLFSRRQMLAAVGATGSSVFGVGLARRDTLVAAQNGAALTEPVIRESNNGLLTGTLTANLDTSRGPGAEAFGSGVGFGGLVPGPTLRAAPGDKIKITLENRLGEPTNLHVHGLHVTPLGRGDNVFIHVMPGKSWDYEYEIPAEHPSGHFWYHPHHHGLARNQTDAGLAGAIVIAEGRDEPPEVNAARVQRLLVLQRLDPSPDPKVSYYVNGQVNPLITIQEGEVQLWRIINASADDFFNLRIVGHSLRRVGIDGNWIPSFRDDPELKVLPLGPAERADILVEGLASELEQDENERHFEVRSLHKSGRPDRPFFDEDFVDDESPEAPFDVIATLKLTKTDGELETVAGTPEANIPTSVIDLRGHEGVVTRNIRFQLDVNTGSLTIDSRSFNADRIDQTVALGAVEEWTIFNETTEGLGWHPFHLHVNDFDVLETSHSGLQGQYYQDTIPLPPATEQDQPGWVRFRSQFSDFTGKFVYHCHILNHEDKGMMGVVEVVQPIKIADATFEPSSVAIVVGTTVLWTNHDDAAHTVSDRNGSFTSGPLARGQAFTYTFDLPGSIEVSVDDDTSTQGTVIVEETRSVELVGNVFEPADVQVGKNSTVVWTNRDSEPHVIAAADGSFASDLLAQKDSFRHTFDTVGSFAYHGDGQQSAQGTISVSATEATSKASVWISDDGFNPSDLIVPLGTTVSWTNRASRAHTVTAHDMNSFDSGRLDAEQPFSPGQRFSHTFGVPGILRYHSALSMRGRIRVLPSATPGDALVDIDDVGFTPEMREIAVGATVTWSNCGSALHNITFTAPNGTIFDSGTLEPGKSVSHTYDKRGDFDYYDALHPSIEGEVVVR